MKGFCRRSAGIRSIEWPPLRRSGATDIRIVYAANPDAARDRLIAAGLEPVTIEPVGPSLSSRLVARLQDQLRRMANRTAHRSAAPRAAATTQKHVSNPMLAAACLLATASVTLMLGSWALTFVTIWQTNRILREGAEPIARYQHRVSDERARTLARPAMTEPGPSEILGRLAVLLPSDTGLVSAARDSGGALRIELDALDPDQIRPILTGDPLFRSLKEVSQAQTSEGKMRVAWMSAPR
jgi:hypothetical protein